MKNIHYYGIVFLLSVACIMALWSFSTSDDHTILSPKFLQDQIHLIESDIQKQIDRKEYSTLHTDYISYAVYERDTILGWSSKKMLPHKICVDGSEVHLLHKGQWKNTSYCIGIEVGDDINFTINKRDGSAYFEKTNTISKHQKAYLLVLLTLLVYITGVKLLSYLPRKLEFIAISLYSILIPWIHTRINTYSVVSTTLDIDIVTIVCLSIYFLALSRILNKGMVELRTKLSYFGTYLVISLSIFGYYHLIHTFIQYSDLYTLSSTAIQYHFNGMVFLGAIVALGISLFFLHYSLTSQILDKVDLKNRYIYQGIAYGVACVFYYMITDSNVGIAAFVVAYILILDVFTEYRKSTLIYGFWWLILLSGFIAASTYKATIDKDRKDRRAYVQDLYMQSNPNEAAMVKRISHKLLESIVFTPLAELSGLETLDVDDYKTYVTSQIGLDTILDTNYTFDIYGFNALNTSLFAQNVVSINDVNYELSLSRSIDNRIAHNPFTDTYYLRYDIESTGKKPHRVILSLSKKGPVPTKNIDAVGYTILKDSQVIYTQNSRVFPGSTQDLIRADEHTFFNEYSYIIDDPAEGIRIVSYKKVAGIARAISLFSLILALASIISLVLTYVNKRWQVIPRQIAFDGDDHTSLSRRIQSSIILLIVFSFIIIGIVTTYYFKNVLDTSSREHAANSNFALLKSIRHRVEGADTNLSASILLRKNMQQIEDIHDRDLIIYDTDLSYVSDPESPMISMEEKSSLDRGLPIDQYHGNNHRIIYPLYHASKMPYAYASIDSSTVKNKYSILDFLSTILNVYVFLFLTAAAIAIGISNSITKPLTKLAEKLKRFKLGKQNATIEWNTKDEIGILINDYNNLVVKLQESADIIAKTHRDTAWREMAKQVAHEIKNPLTPMKLTIQYLERKIQADPENAEALIARASSTLIEQIDNLSRIADEFSNFATMPKTNNANVIVNEVVETIHDLFRKREDINITLQLPINDITVFADKNQLSRVLINIVKNAIQAIPTHRKGKIDIHLYTQNGNALIEVSDNGTGISDEMKERVFEPNFTTKNSGTGLGLAMSANIIEAFNGKLYFKTEKDIGTSFYIEIPLMRLESNYDGINRISLN